MKRKIRLTESDLHRVIKESVNKVLREDVSDDDYLDLKQIVIKAFSNLNEEEKQHLYHLIQNETWYVVYVMEEILKTS